MPRVDRQRERWQNAVFFFVAILVILADQFSKEWIKANLAAGQSLFDIGFFRIIHIYNTGAAFGLFAEHTLVLTVVSSVAVVVLLLCGTSLQRYLPFLAHPHPTGVEGTWLVTDGLIPEGSFIGYGCTYRTTRDSRIAVLPVGYFEGYDRGLSGMAHVLVRGKRAPLRGRVCMNITLADVTDIPGVAVGDEVVLLGRQGDEAVSAEELASIAGTINYDVICGIGKRVTRTYIESGETIGMRTLTERRSVGRRPGITR